MSHQTESSPPLSAAESLLGRAVLPLSFPTPGPSLTHHDWRTQGRAYAGTRSLLWPGDRAARVLALQVPPEAPLGWTGGPGLRMRVEEECCPQNFKGQGKAGARGNDTKMPSPKPWILLKKARNSDTNLSLVAEKGPICPPSLSSVCSELPEL